MASLQKRLNRLREDIRLSRRGSKKTGQDQPTPAPGLEKGFLDEAGNIGAYEIPASPLFRLPREIRDKIWGYVLAQNLIHVGNPSSKKITHILCRAPMSDRLAHDMYPYRELNEAFWDDHRRKLPPGQDYVDYRIKDKRMLNYQFRHSFCFTDSWWLASDVSPPYEPKLQEAIGRIQLSLTLMRTCRAIYAETVPLLWAYNSFGFAKSVTFQSFMKPRTTFQRESMRHLALKPESPLQITYPLLRRMVLDRHGYSTWMRALELLPNLTSVYLTACYDLSRREAEEILCHGGLVTPIGPGGGIEIIDALVEKPAMTNFHPRAENIEIWDVDGGGPFILPSENKMLCRDLEELLQKRVMSHKNKQNTVSGGGGDPDPNACRKLELNSKQLEERRAIWHEMNLRGGF